MKPKDIKVGKTYVNRGAGKTWRRVIAIGNAHRPQQYYDGKGGKNAPDEPGVAYECGKIGRSGKIDGVGNLYLSSFASWCSKEVAKT